MVIDLILNNIPEYRRTPLYVDFDCYIYEGNDPRMLLTAGGCILKTHLPQRPFDNQTKSLLKQIARPGLVIIPVRDPEKIWLSLRNWGYDISIKKLEDLHERHLDFWRDHAPVIVESRDMLRPDTAAGFLESLRLTLGLKEEKPAAAVVARGPSWIILWRKLQTRRRGAAAPVINTTVGFKT